MLNSFKVSLRFLFAASLVLSQGCLGDKKTNEEDVQEEVFTSADTDSIGSFYQNASEIPKEFKAVKYELNSIHINSIPNKEDRKQFYDEASGKYYVYVLIKKSKEDLIPNLTTDFVVSHTTEDHSHIQKLLEKVEIYDGQLMNVHFEKPHVSGVSTGMDLNVSLMTYSPGDQGKLEIYGSVQWLNNDYFINFYGDNQVMHPIGAIDIMDPGRIPRSSKLTYQASMAKSFDKSYDYKGVLYVLGSYLSQRVHFKTFFNVEILLNNLHYLGPDIEVDRANVSRLKQGIKDVEAELEGLDAASFPQQFENDRGELVFMTFSERRDHLLEKSSGLKGQVAAEFLHGISKRVTSDGRFGSPDKYAFHINYTESVFFLNNKSIVGALGLSWIGTVCRSQFKYIFSRPYIRDNNKNSRYHLDTHEISHALGAGHEVSPVSGENLLMKAYIKVNQVEYTYVDENNISNILNATSIVDPETGFCKLFNKTTKQVKSLTKEPELSIHRGQGH